MRTVVEVTVTATWPLVSLCTWTTLPLTAAIVPEAPGRVPAWPAVAAG
ncbi:hypothetical protein GCM10028772_16820 [Nocardioides ultimimeridianus]